MASAHRSLRWFAAAALGLGVALSGAVAAAQTAPARPTAMAEGLFQQARELFKQQQYAEACPLFAESQRLEPKLGTLLNLAVCHEKLGKIATAWAEYTSSASIAQRQNRKERAAFAREKVAALELRIARVTLQIAAPPADLVVSLDDQRLDHTALNTPLPVDPGSHRVAVSAPGKTAWSTTFDAPSELAEIPVLIPDLAPDIEPAPPPLVAAPPAKEVIAPALLVAPPRAAEPQVVREDHRVLVYGGFGVGAAGVLVGAITGAVTLANAGAIRGACHDNFCAETQRDAIGSATTLANVSNVSFVVGALGGGVGVVGLLLSRPHLVASPKTSLVVTPTLGPGSLGVRGSF